MNTRVKFLVFGMFSLLISTMFVESGSWFLVLVFGSIGVSLFAVDYLRYG